MPLHGFPNCADCRLWSPSGRRELPSNRYAPAGPYAFKTLEGLFCEGHNATRLTPPDLVHSYGGYRSPGLQSYDLGVAHHIGDRRGIGELASSLGSTWSALHAHGMFQRRTAGPHALITLLRRDHPGLRALAQMIMPFVGLLTDQASPDRHRDAESQGRLCLRLQDRPDEAEIIARAMTARAIDQCGDRTSTSHAGGTPRIGGGRGHLPMQAMKAPPAHRGGRGLIQPTRSDRRTRDRQPQEDHRQILPTRT